MRRLLFGCVLGFSIASTSLARAEEAAAPVSGNSGPSGFGARGMVALDDLLGVRASTPELVGAATLGGVGFPGLVSYGTSHSDSPAGSSDYTSIGFSPAVDYFVMDRLSVGARIDFLAFRQSNDSQGSSRRTTGYSLSAQPRVGYVVRLDDSLSLWPRLGIGYGTSHQDSESASAMLTTWTVTAELGIVVRLGRYGTLNLGPDLTYVARSSDRPSSGLSLGNSSSVGGGVHATIGLVF
jgi:hypothetical protein